MNEATAEELVAELARATTGWNDDSALDWVDRLLDHDEAPARVAVRGLIDEWTASSRPPWGRFKEAYRAEARRRREDHIALPATRDPDAISLGAYLSRLAKRAEQDPVAAAELKRWHRVRRNAPVAATALDINQESQA